MTFAIVKGFHDRFVKRLAEIVAIKTDSMLLIGLGGAFVVAASFRGTPQFLDYRESMQIGIIEATYGGNCQGFKVTVPGTVNAVRQGNATDFAVGACKGMRNSCVVMVSTSQLGDPAPGCGNEFFVKWQCGNAFDIHHASINAEANLKSLTILCK